MAVDQLLIVPCYNEAKRFQATPFEKALQAYPTLGFVFVNDGSRDETFKVLREFAAKHAERAVALSLPRNQGKSGAVRQGMLWAFGKSEWETMLPWDVSHFRYVGYWDCDLATPFAELAAFQVVFAEHPEVQLAMGSRIKLLGRQVERHMYRHYLGRVFATAASMVLKLPVYDTQCGAKIFKYNALTAQLFAQPFVSRWVFDVEILARLCQALGHAGQVTAASVIHEVPLRVWRDIGGSKVKATDFLKAFWALVRIAWIYK